MCDRQDCLRSSLTLTTGPRLLLLSLDGNPPAFLLSRISAFELESSSFTEARECFEL